MKPILPGLPFPKFAVPLVLAFALAGGRSLHSQETGSQKESGQQAAGQQATAVAPATIRIAIAGASMSDGFELRAFSSMLKGAQADAEQQLGRELTDDEIELRSRTIDVATALRGAYGDTAEIVADPSSQMLFMSPVSGVETQVKKIAASEPDLVIGLDLMFWLGYGSMAGADAEEQEANRLSLQATGLALIDEHLVKRDAIVVLGDYADITGCWTGMISPSMIPAKETFTTLNERLRAWAAERPNVYVFPLAQTLADARNKGVDYEVDGDSQHLSLDQLFQLDRVHPTRIGTAATVSALGDWMATHIADSDLHFAVRGVGPLIAATAN